jgi:glycosyltransferase involved in cell wall biosynthesis
VNNELFNLFKNLKCCVIVPTYNNSSTLPYVINDLLAYTENIIVVNDGSTDESKIILEKYTSISVINLEQNKGKGNALRTGFKFAVAKDFDYAITIDSDGQHNANDLSKFIDILKSEPGTLVIGARNMEQDSVPGKSSFGHKFSNFWFRVETGINLPDTQSGYRLYPIKALDKMLFFTSKFEFEIEVIVRAAWKGIPVKCIPISVYYAPKGERVSHFRPFKDFFRISVLNTVLFLMAVFYFLPKNFLRNFNGKKLRILLGSNETTFRLSLAAGFGAFMGVFPIWGYQMIAAFFLAHLLKLNKAFVLLASNISIFPLPPFIMYAGFILGKSFVKKPVDLAFNMQITFASVKTSLIQFFVGSIILAIFAGIAVTLLSYIILKIKRGNNKLVTE